MSNQVVLITGALTGIGRATAVAFAKAGANIVISGRHADEGQKLAAELALLSMLAASTPWKALPRQPPSSLPRPESGSTSWLPDQSRQEC